MGALLERQERINRLLAAAYDYEGQMAPRFGSRLERLEREWKEWRGHEVAANLHSVYFQARFGGGEPGIRRESEAFVGLYRGRKRVLDLGSGRGIFLQLLKDKGIGGDGGGPPPPGGGPGPRKGGPGRQGEGLPPHPASDAGRAAGPSPRPPPRGPPPGERPAS